MCLSVGLDGNSLHTWCSKFLILTRYCYSASLLGRYFKTQRSSIDMECKKNGMNKITTVMQYIMA